MIYAVGDIHGQHGMLQALLKKVYDLPLRTDDTLVFLGDYIDRGKDSRAVIESLLELQIQRPDTIFLRGNHEQMLLDVFDYSDKPILNVSPVARAARMLVWLRNGGAEALLSYESPDFRRWHEAVIEIHGSIPGVPDADLLANYLQWLDVIPEPHLAFVRGTQLEYLTARYHFVHAGLLEPGQTWASEGWCTDPRLWIRQPFLSSRADFGGRIVVFGHTPQRGGRPLVRPNKICLDTGAAFGGPLTAGIFSSDGRDAEPRFLQVANADAPPAYSDRANPRASSARSRRK